VAKRKRPRKHPIKNYSCNQCGHLLDFEGRHVPTCPMAKTPRPVRPPPVLPGGRAPWNPPGSGS
jgi:hypothetical protein